MRIGKTNKQKSQPIAVSDDALDKVGGGIDWEGHPQSDNVYYGTSWGDPIHLPASNPHSYTDAWIYDGWMHTNEWF